MGAEATICIAIPTRGRADLLDLLLGELDTQLAEHRHRFVIAVSDNRSEDSTAEVCRRWERRFADSGVGFRWSTAAEPLTVNQSIRRAIGMSTEPWTWTLGDDDELVPGVVSFVCAAVDDRPDLALLLLNHSGRALNDQHRPVDSYFSGALDSAPGDDGLAVFAHQLDHSFDGMIFIGSPVYRTALVQQALARWDGAVGNFALLVWLAGYCAAHGPVRVSADPWLVNILGRSQWEQHPNRATLLTYFEFPEVLLRLRAEGLGRRAAHHSMRVMCRRWGITPWTVRRHVSAVRHRRRPPIDLLRALWG